MIIFKKREENIYLITNYKVMYTTLSNQKSLIQICNFDQLNLTTLLSFFSTKNKVYFIVRNPFDRIESFYKSKFLKAEENRLWMLEHEKGKKWQKCTEPFFPYLGINAAMDPLVVSKKLSSVKIEEVISILPNVFMEDGHMTPQFYAGQYTYKKYGLSLNIPIRFKKIFKIETAEDLKDLSKVFNLELSKKYNNTNDTRRDIQWTLQSIKTIENIYDKDFKNYNYEKRS